MHPDNIKSGDLLDQYGKPEEAAPVYLRNLKKQREKLELGGSSPAAEENLQIAVGRVERMAQNFLRAGKFGQALECAEEGIAALPDKLELHAVRAHALMFLDRDKEAQATFLQHRGAKVGEQPWEAAILQGFDEQRKAGRSRLLMTVIENELAPGGESAQAKGTNTPTGSHNDVSISTLIQSSETQAGETLKELGRLDEALAVQIRCLENYKTKCANGQVNNRLIDDRNAAIDRIIGLAAEFLANGDFNKALDGVDRALSVLPHLPLLNIYRAHALMFLDREDEARAVYMQSRDQRVDAERCGEAHILQNFAALRNADLTRPLMDEIERLFAVERQIDPALDGRGNAADHPSCPADGADSGYRVHGPGVGLLSGSGRGPRTT
jgi:Tfp pilus assembly protein PilF